jgi:hypothetical protein
MAIPEPNSPLWKAVKAIDDTWPPDDEVVARDLGAALGRGADAMAQGARQTGRAGADAVASWRDMAGDKFGGKVDEFAQSAARVDQSMRGVAAHAERYAGELESAKNSITSTIAANEPTHAQLANPMLGPVGPTLQNAYATQVATDLRAMIDAKAAGLGGGPAPAQPPAEQPPAAQPPAEQPDQRNPVAAFVGDTLRALGDGDVQRARAIGETVDDGIDALGTGAGNVLRALGATDAGNAVEQGADGLGDTAAENWLQQGATSRNLGYDLAQGIDGTDQPRTVYISHERYPEAAAHIDDAQNGTIWKGFESAPGEPKDSVLTVEREHAQERREAATSVVPPLQPDYDRDEYPPAVAKEGGPGSSVQYIDPSDNRGAGATQGNQLNGKTGSIERQLDGTGLQVIGDGKAANGDLFRVETF